MPINTHEQATLMSMNTHEQATLMPMNTHEQATLMPVNTPEQATLMSMNTHSGEATASLLNEVNSLTVGKNLLQKALIIFLKSRPHSGWVLFIPLVDLQGFYCNKFCKHHQ